MRLTPNNLLLSPIRENQQNCCTTLCKSVDISLNQCDILACNPAQQNDEKTRFNPQKSGQPVFMILAYPPMKNGKRLRKVLYFHHMSGSGSWNEAARIRDTWVHAILTTFFPLLEENIYSPMRHHKRLLIILNPYAGKGHAARVMRNKIGPILQDTGVEYEVLVTERQGHSHEIVQAEPNLAKR